MTLKTRFNELVGIEHPIVQGGMMNVGLAELAAAVSEAGGLGIITALALPSPEALAAEIRKARRLTNKPIGVNITLLPMLNAPNYGDYVKVIVDAGITVVETAGSGALAEFWAMFKQAGVKVIHKCTSVRHAVSAQRKGVDVISIDGFECAGHPGEDDVGGLVLIPAAVDQLDIPVIASGGIADGRGLVAALSLGAEGINMGTRFCATKEAPIHDNVKQAFLANDERGTNIIFRKFHNSARVAKSGVSDEVVRISAKPDSQFEDIRHLVSGAQGRVVLETGDLDAGIFWASQAQGLIHDIPTVRDVIDRIIAEAEEIISARLASLVRQPATVVS